MCSESKSLHIKILSGYAVLLTVIGCITGIFLHERKRMKGIETEAKEIQELHRNIYNAHKNVAKLAFLGESVIGWDDGDLETYRNKRLETDSLLNILEGNCESFIRPEEVDSLRILLEDKEKHLSRIMELLHKQDQIDSLMINRLPVVAKQATRTRQITRKRKGIAGLFGKKETITVPSSAKPLYELNDRLVDLQKKQSRRMEIYIDSLSIENEILNRKLIGMIERLDNQAQAAFQCRSEEMTRMRQDSFRMIAGIIGFSLVLLILSYFIIHRDIRQKTAGQKKMRHLLDEYNDLLAMSRKTILAVSHDIRGPLNVINNCIKWAMTAKSKKARDNYLRKVRHSYNHILQLVNNLLDVYRLNEAKETRNDTPFHLASLLERIASEYALLANDKGLLFFKEFKEVDVVVKGDSDRLEQILDNLLANAIKFTEQGSVTLVAGYERGMLNMKVEDTGIGMSRETVQKIFNPFEQAAPEMNAGGFGLGLAIVLGIVHLLGGKINVESRLGKGSSFRVSLPMPVTTEEVEREIQPDVLPEDLPQFVIAIEDDPMQLELCKEMLERNGVRCTACSHVRQLVEKMRKHDYDLLLTDIQMPGTNGFDLLKLMRNSDIGNSKTIPIVAMTARGEYETEKLVDAGFAGCIHKPYSSKDLLQIISKHYKREPKEEPVDFSPMTEEAQDKVKILEMFITETTKNMEDLEATLKDMDREAMRQTIHRMLPMWEMLRVESVLNNFRALLKDKNSEDKQVEAQTRRVMAFCLKLINEAKQAQKEYGKDFDC